MALTSIGYAGTIGPGGWVDIQRTIGCRYAVVHPSHLRLGATTAGVTLSAGMAGGGGVYDRWDTESLVPLTKPGSGTAWWLIVIRRDWTSLTTSLVAIPAGTSTPAALPARNTVMGGVDDQPLWLVPWSSSSATPALASAVDLRLIGRGPSNYVAVSDRVREYFSEAGATLRIGGRDWQCNLGAGDTLSWVQIGTGFTAGSNSNGSWREFADGTLRCHHQLVFPDKPGKSQNLIWTFPKAFAAPPMVKCTLYTTAPENCDIGVASRTASSVSVEFKRSTSASTTVLLEAETW